MNLHENKSLFVDAVLSAAQHLGIKPSYIEKDYWITRTLKQMVDADKDKRAIFKGGTSLSKAHSIGFRFSEDVDVAIVDASTISGNQLKTLIRRLAKSMTAGLVEIPMDGVTSKGSRYYKAIYGYEANPEFTNAASLGVEPMKIGQLMVEINSFANPYPHVPRSITNFIGIFLKDLGRDDLIEQYDLGEFSLNVLDAKRTLTEKLVSLIRFSLSDNYRYELPAKIRHFYDLHYLMQETDCIAYVQSPSFREDFEELLKHDREEFEKPYGWREKSVASSVLVSDFASFWGDTLVTAYNRELPNIAYKEVPTPGSVAESFVKILSYLPK